MSDYIFSIIAKAGESILFFDITLFNQNVKIPFLIFWLLAASLYFSVILRFKNFTLIPKAFGIFFNEIKNQKSIKAKNLASSASIVLTSIGGSVDLGSIFAVATIVSIGGPGTIFWLLIAGILSTSIRFTEVFYGHKLRTKVSSHGKLTGFIGGPQVYIKKAFKLYKIGKIGNIMTKIYAFNVAISTFFSLQLNQTTHVIIHTVESLQSKQWLVALIIAIIVLSIILGGIKSVTKFGEKAVPLMIISYIIATIIVILKHYDQVLPSLYLIVQDAMSFKAINGSILGAFVLGFQRAFFCNESGTGSGAIIHSSSSNENSYKEATISIVSPIISVLIVCFCSGLIVLVSKAYTMTSLSGVALIVHAFNTVHPLMEYMTLVIVPLFGLTTATAWAYYGSQSWSNLFGKKYISIYYILLFIAYLFSGMVKDFGIILQIADILLLSTTIPNIIALVMLSRFTKKIQ